MLGPLYADAVVWWNTFCIDNMCYCGLIVNTSGHVFEFAEAILTLIKMYLLY